MTRPPGSMPQRVSLEPLIHAPVEAVHPADPTRPSTMVRPREMSLGRCGTQAGGAPELTRMPQEAGLGGTGPSVLHRLSPVDFANLRDALDH